MGLLAGADRIEGTLFGNGERTGNVDIITLALNMYSQGVEPNLDFTNMGAICEKYEEFTGMKIGERSPYLSLIHISIVLDGKCLHGHDSVSVLLYKRQHRTQSH